MTLTDFPLYRAKGQPSRGATSVHLAIALATSFALFCLAGPVMGQSAESDGPAAVPGLPSGVIVMWSGALDAIPAGWALCDGRDGTPDLRNRFVLGAGNAEYLGTTGGSRTHKHAIRDHLHQVDPPAFRSHSAHGYSAYRGGSTRSRYYMLSEQTVNIRPFKSGAAKVVSGPVSQLPPYYKIAFIIKR